MMKLMSLKQYMKMSKPALIRKITKSIRVMPKRKLAYLCYEISKSKLPRLRVKSIGEPSVKSSDYAFTPKGILEWNKAIKLKQKRITKRKALPRRKTKRKSLAYNDLGFGESLKSMRKKKRKFSQRQLKAQRLFAKRARAGTLKRRRR